MTFKNWIYTLLGIVIVMVSLWGGAYILHDSGHTWYSFPTFMTSFNFGVLGVFIFIYGVSL